MEDVNRGPDQASSIARGHSKIVHFILDFPSKQLRFKDRMLGMRCGTLCSSMERATVPYSFEYKDQELCVYLCV